MYSGEKTWEELLRFLSSRNIRIGGFAKCGILTCQRRHGNSTEYFYFKAVEKPSITVYVPVKQIEKEA